MNVETKFLRLRKPVELGHMIAGCACVGWTDGTRAVFSMWAWFGA
jgi:hypothetical protein